jgi:hypothetical protein
MKKMKTIMLILFISFLPLSLAFGQEKKNEQKVKVVIADKSGTKIVIDTTFTGTDKVDSIILKGGNVTYIGKADSESDINPGKQVKVIAHVDKDGSNSGYQYVYINDGKVIQHNGDSEFDILVSEDESDGDLDITRYVIAKNGITVSIEGNDEVRVKELATEIEKKLGVNNEKSEPVVKKVEKEVIKKK